MSVSIGVRAAGTKLLDASLSRRSERDGSTEGAMTAQNSAEEAQSEGLKAKRTALDRLVDQPSPLDRFA